MKFTLLAFCLAGIFLPLSQSWSSDFEDGFESGDMSASNSSGFSWGNNNRTSVVTADRVVWNNGPKDRPIGAGEDWTPYDGAHSLRFRYHGDGANQWSEQRFSLGDDYSEFWVSYMIRVPFNYTHRNATPQNSKFFEIWTDGKGNQGSGGTVTWNMLRDNADGGSRLAFSDSDGSRGSSFQQASKFIAVPGDRGRWMQVVIQIVLSTSRSSNDGQVRLWRRWDGSQNFELIHEGTDRDIPRDSGGRGLQDGYLMGWSNPGYDEETDWLIDNFQISATSLLAAGGGTADPNPPTDVTVE